jgi:hypothetical protein
VDARAAVVWRLIEPGTRIEPCVRVRIPRPRARHWRFFLVQTTATLVLCELALRLVTTTSDTGLVTLGSCVLVPYRATAEVARVAIARPAEYVIADPDLGWTVRPGGRSADGLYEANSEGARAPASRQYGDRPPPDGVRIVAVGDSFTHGDGVSVEDTWEREMERRRPGLEVVNLGVPAYGTDQAYLRWRRDGARLHPRIALLGIWPEDICRNLNLVRFFFQPSGPSAFLSKPRFLLSDGRLERINTPVLDPESVVRAVTEPERVPLLADEFWARPGDFQPGAWQSVRLARVAATLASLYERHRLRERLYAGTDARGIELAAAIAEAFARDAREEGAEPVVVLFPRSDALPSGNASPPLARALSARGLDVIDLGPDMARAVDAGGVGCCYLADRHLSPAGNRRVAASMLDRLGPRLMATTEAGGSGNGRGR